MSSIPLQLKTKLLSEPLWSGYDKIVSCLRANGFISYLAGGAVRDLLLGKSLKDLDIVTNARPDQVEALFPNTIPVGKQFGIIIVREDQNSYEVATFRTDGIYINGRRPESIAFATPEQDAERRDFTVNALFYDDAKDCLYDFVNGQKDLATHTLRAVGNPTARFQEDHLRILRALRLQVQLDFKLEEDTETALLSLVETVKTVSPERIRSEILKGLIIHPTKMFELLKNARLIDILFGGLLKTPEVPFIFTINRSYSDSQLWALFLLQVSSPSRESLGKTHSGEWEWDREFLGWLKAWGKTLVWSHAELQEISWWILGMQWECHANDLRKGYLLELCQERPDFFKWILQQNENLTRELRQETEKILAYSQKSPPPFLRGDELPTDIPAALRGKVLKEIRYRQWEGLLLDKTAALRWLTSYEKKDFL